jgi:hypothetical protein
MFLTWRRANCHPVTDYTRLWVVCQPGGLDAFGVSLPYIAFHLLFRGTSNHSHPQPEHLGKVDTGLIVITVALVVVR